jgi:hypothetical protein
VTPRVREDSVHPRLQSGARMRPLNFTVRPHAKRQRTYLAPRGCEMTAVTVKRFVRNLAEGARAHYSIRRRADGLFQVYHDDPYVGINQPYQFDDKAISGLFAEVETAEAELLKLHPDVEAEDRGS